MDMDITTLQRPATELVQRPSTTMRLSSPYATTRYGMLETTRNSLSAPYATARYEMINNSRNVMRTYDYQYYTYYAYDPDGKLVPHTGIRTIFF